MFGIRKEGKQKKSHKRDGRSKEGGRREREGPPTGRSELWVISLVMGGNFHQFNEEEEKVDANRIRKGA